MEYKIVSRGPFEKVEKFQMRLNEMAMSGWRVITTHGDLSIIMGKQKH